jgi:hypothetical protein
MNIAGFSVLPALPDDLALRARVLAIRADLLIRQQGDFVVHCRTQAAALRQSGERCGFAELRATIFRLASSYEQLAASTEQFVRRFAKAPDDDAGTRDWELREAKAA